MKTFIKTFEIDEALGWNLYKDEPGRGSLWTVQRMPLIALEEISGSVFTVEIQVKDKAFVVTLTEGEES